MIDRPPKESELISWLYVFAWTMVVFLTIPIARRLTTYVDNEWGREFFTYAVIGIATIVTARVLYYLIGRGRTSFVEYIWLIIVLGIIVYQAYELKSSSPEESIHYIQYGVLSILIYRALTHRIRDYSIFLAATLVGALIGTIDEIIQWFVPKRYFDLRDIWINLTAIILIQVALATSIRPAIISGWPGPESWRRLCYLGACVVAVLGACQLNTPNFIAVYTARIPALAFIRDFDDVMAEYGYLYDDPQVGIFRSRLSPEELNKSDNNRAEAVSEILDKYKTREAYIKFLEIYTATKDPFAHEARVHLFSRDVNLDRAIKTSDPQQSRPHYNAAARENRILEKYFTKTLDLSQYKWPDSIKQKVYDIIPSSKNMESIVSRHLITRINANQMLLCISIGVLFLLVLGKYFGHLAQRKATSYLD